MPKPVSKPSPYYYGLNPTKENLTVLPDERALIEPTPHEQALDSWRVL